MTDELRVIIECLSSQLDRGLEAMRRGTAADAIQARPVERCLAHEIADWTAVCQWVEELSIQEPDLLTLLGKLNEVDERGPGRMRVLFIAALGVLARERWKREAHLPAVELPF
jgi:hypothetical protein